MDEIIFTPSDFVSVLNQTLEFAYPLVTIEGELANVRVSRNKWVYFDIKDDQSSIKCFGTVYMLPGPIEEGMRVRIVASPRLHPLYNFSLNLQSVIPIGEGSIKRAADLLLAKLEKEGLFDPARKRTLPYAPKTVGLITSKESAAYADFNKILNERWSGVRILHYDVQVQGGSSVAEIVEAVTYMNQLQIPPEVLIITRGGGSADDLAAFNSEQVVRAVASSRIPTMVAIGHEVDVSLSEMAADQRASTPSNAAQLLVPNKIEELRRIKEIRKSLFQILSQKFEDTMRDLKESYKMLNNIMEQSYFVSEQTLRRQIDLLEALNPEMALRRGYAVIRSKKGIIKSIKSMIPGDNISIQMQDGTATAKINKVQ